MKFDFKRRNQLKSGILKGKRVGIFQLFWGGKQTNIFNFFEMNYRIGVGILLRKPVLHEFLIAKQKRMISLLLIKRLYFSY